MTEKEEAAQQRVREEARALTALRDRLKEIAGDLPQAAWELDPGDLVDDPEVAAEIRCVIECVLVDRLQPAIEDLLAVADYRKGEGGGGGVIAGQVAEPASTRARTDKDRAEREDGSQIGDRQLDELEVARRER